MKIHNVEFVTSAVTKDQYPNDRHPEIVLSGRSNVGKSSFINSILNRKNVAYTSSKPGKTQTLNFFHINDSFYFVDVPGYGYAKVSKKDREEFEQMIEEYLVHREELTLVGLIVDLRHDPTEDDIIMYEYLKSYQIPVLVVATKLDKVPKTKRIRHEKAIKQGLKMAPNDLFISYSSETKENKENILKIIEEVISI